MNRKTVLIVQLCTLLILLFVVIGIAVSYFAKDNSYYGNWLSKTTKKEIFYDVEHINVDARSQSINIREHDEDYVLVTEEEVGYRYKATDSKLYAEDNTVFYESKRLGGFLNFQAVTVTIQVPKASKYNYDISVSSGNLDFDASCDTTDINASSGSIKAKGSGREINAEASSGSIKVYAGFDKVTAQTSSGSIKVAAAPNTDSVEVSASSGSIKIQLPREKGYQLNYSVSSGSVKDSYQGIKADDSKNGEWMQGDGALSIEAETASGSIRLADWD